MYKSIYILSEKGKLAKEDRHLIYTNAAGDKQSILPRHMKYLIILGNVTITGEAFKILVGFKIAVLYTDFKGAFIAQLDYGESKNIALRQQQYRFSLSESRRLDIARAIVAGKIKNQLSFLQRIKREKVENENFRTSVMMLKVMIKKAGTTQSLQSLRGIEGIAAKNYFTCFAENIKPDWAVFDKREKNPPTSNVNAVLSFLYTLLAQRIKCAIISQGLDSMQGTLHEITYGKETLVYDLMEEFRVPIADTLCSALFNLNTLKQDDFRKGKTSQSESVYLTYDGAVKTIRAFEEKCETEIRYAPTENTLTYNEIFFRQAEMYKEVMTGNKPCYVPYYFK